VHRQTLAEYRYWAVQEMLDRPPIEVAERHGATWRSLSN
jgi:hypothetical protein